MHDSKLFTVICICLLAVIVLSGCGWFDNGEEESEDGYQGIVVLPTPINDTYYEADQILYFAVIDKDLAQSNMINVYVNSSIDAFDVVCKEEGNTGVFMGEIRLNTYGSYPDSDPPKLCVSTTDIINISYSDENPEAIVEKNVQFESGG